MNNRISIRIKVKSNCMFAESAIIKYLNLLWRLDCRRWWLQREKSVWDSVKFQGKIRGYSSNWDSTSQRCDGPPTRIHSRKSPFEYPLHRNTSPDLNFAILLFLLLFMLLILTTTRVITKDFSSLPRFPKLLINLTLRLVTVADHLTFAKSSER